MTRVNGRTIVALSAATCLLGAALADAPLGGAESSPLAHRLLNVALNVPNLVPQALQYAVFERDPLVAFAGRLKSTSRFSRASSDQVDGDARLRMAWNLGFREITGDKVHLLANGPDGRTGQVDAPSFVSSGKKWVATKAVQIDGKAAAWCIPLEFKTGQTVDLVFDRGNRLILEEIAAKGGPPMARQPVTVDRPRSDDAARLNGEGWRLFQQGQMREALDKFEEAVKLDDRNEAAWNGLGWAGFSSGKLAEAETAFRRTIELNPAAVGALNGLGQIYFRQRKYDLAETCLLKAAPNAPAAWWGLAKLYLLQGKFADAEKWATKIVDASQGDAANSDSARRILQAAKDKQLSDELRSMIEPAGESR